MRLLRARLLAFERDQAQDARNRNRRDQVGTGMRGDKIRTVAVQRGQVTDHRTGKKISLKQFLRGDLEALR